MKRSFFVVVFALFAMAVIAPSSADAVPAFARKYGFNCNMCHVSYSRLNDFGQRMRDNGYQIPGQEAGEKTVFDTPPPLALRTSAGLQLTRTGQRVTSTFTPNGLDLLAAGVLHKNISFLLIYTPRIDEPTADYTGADSAGPSQPGALESANLVFSNLVPDLLNVRVGRFEPGYHVISSKRSYYLCSPYEVYTFATPNNNFLFDDNQMGVEATGHYRTGFDYSCGVINGTGARPDNNSYKDVYITAHQVIGRGSGQSAGQRIGLFGYLGWQPTRVPGNLIGNNGETNGRPNKSFHRIGGDIGLNWLTLNVRGLFMQGQDDKAFNTLDSTTAYKFTGGFAELSYSSLFNNRLVTSLLFNWVTPPDYDKAAKVTACSVLLRYYLGDWKAVNVSLHGEYRHRQIGDPTSYKEDLFAFMVDWAF